MAVKAPKRRTVKKETEVVKPKGIVKEKFGEKTKEAFGRPLEHQKFK